MTEWVEGTHPAFIAGRNAKNAEISALGFEQALDNYRAHWYTPNYGSGSGMQYARGERSALRGHRPFCLIL